MNKCIGSNIDDFLKEESLLEGAEAVAIKRVLAYQVQEELKKRHISKTNRRNRCTQAEHL